jgi:hypothetical protein
MRYFNPMETAFRGVSVRGFCDDDIVMQGCGSIRGLVSALYSMVFLVGLIPKRNRAQRFSRNTDI